MIAKLRAYFTILQMFFTVSIVIILMFLFRGKNHTIRQKWAKMQMKLLGIKLEIEGDIDPEANMLMINHQSLLDIIVLEYLHTNNISWIAKKEIGDIPWFGNILKLPNMIQVQRESKTSLVKLLKDSKEALETNRTIAIFPEGTRGKGKKLRKFKAGAKIIASKFKLKVQPVILIGTREILDSQNLTQQSGVVKVIFLPTIKADKKTLWWEDIEHNMNERFNQEINKNDS